MVASTYIKVHTLCNDLFPYAELDNKHTLYTLALSQTFKKLVLTNNWLGQVMQLLKLGTWQLIDSINVVIYDFSLFLTSQISF